MGVNTMSKWTIGFSFGQIVGFTSSVFMLYVFLNEAFFNRGVLYFEPNLGIATTEFFVVLAGIVIQGIVMIATALKAGDRRGKEGKEGKERTGYETNNGTVYQ
jgi:hypothetical protein